MKTIDADSHIFEEDYRDTVCMKAGSLDDISGAVQFKKSGRVMPTACPCGTSQNMVSGLPMAWQTLGWLLL